MKTKSKRFLKLATLCLALLGTTLLMGRPVKAEGVYAQPQSSERSTSVNGPSEDSSSEEMKRAKDRKCGYDEGYEQGQESDNRKVDRKSIVVPYYVEDQDEYKDGYEQGFEAGWYDSHPIAALLDMAWYYLTYTFGTLFGGANSQ
ncbi:Uncharacterised protein [Streptococcus pyogenes]|uniref:hypothetical protein n=1 Tax=Streptococcus pyogenes TaxID=1314 RepID=UPI0010A1CA43|nr:hypothetical protein [Streptococcus pyogenes]VGQ33668.1 hypothetical membrane associated protein [Streptococcus pyogenes]VHD88852.1 Uncharacterised protein [Streptococcus pyogenes]